MLPDAALRPELARAVAVRQQHRMARCEQLLGPVAIARCDRLGMAGETAAAMQRNHRRERAVARGHRPPQPQPPGKAVGVDNWQGGWARVHKDETIYLPQGTSVRTARESARAQTGGGTVIHNHFETNTALAAKMAADIVIRQVKRVS